MKDIQPINVLGGELKTIEESLSFYLTTRRKQLNLSQEYVARRCNIARATYNNYENGKRTPTLKQFIKICDVLYLPTQPIIDATVEAL